MRRLSLLTIDSLSLIAYSCSSPAPKQETAASTEAEASVEPETTTVEGWWDLGDFVGPFTATLNGDDILCIERNLSHGEPVRRAIASISSSAAWFATVKCRSCA